MKLVKINKTETAERIYTLSMEELGTLVLFALKAQGYCTGPCPDLFEVTSLSIKGYDYGAKFQPTECTLKVNQKGEIIEQNCDFTIKGSTNEYE